MDIFRICRTCSNQSHSNLVSIYSNLNFGKKDFTTVYDDNSENSSNENQTQIRTFLDELTGNKYNSNEFPYPDKICELCLNDLKIAFDFRQRCVIAFEQLLKLPEEDKLFTEQTIEFKSVEDDKLNVENETSSRINAVAEINIPEFKEEITKSDHNVSIISEQEEGEDKPQADRLRAYQCSICDRSFTRQTHLRRHMTIHTDERAFACKQCDKKFRRADHLKNHENYHAQIKPHNCEQCEKTFSRAEHLRRHISSRHTLNLTTFQCKNCEYTAGSAKELSHHRKSHNVNVFPCKFCDEQFSTKSALNEHTKSHNDERPFLCSECGMRFIRNDYLVIHMRRHTGDKPYKCRFCDRAFPRATDLTVHERYHTNEKKHICDLCGKGFQRAYNLSVHLRVHTGQKPYECPHCSKRFTQNNDLKAHIRRHTGERYQCDICAASFIQFYLLNHHKKNVHGIDTKSHIGRVAKFDSGDGVSPPNQFEGFEQESETSCTEYAGDEC